MTDTIYSLIAGLEAENEQILSNIKNNFDSYDIPCLLDDLETVETNKAKIEALKQVAGMIEAEQIYDKMKFSVAVIRHWGKHIRYTLKGELKAYAKILGTKPREEK